MKRNYNYTTISVEKDVLLILKEVKRHLEQERKAFINMNDVICWLLKQTDFL